MPTQVSGKQPSFHKKFTKQSAWLEITCIADSIDIKFANFGRAELKL